ncbi:efflux RND transporter permease subunit [Lignipirellula cremea]|nr:MMPL family transporter [Lignipirellula cremea]
MAPLLLRYRWPILCAVTVLALLAAAGIPRLRFDFSPQSLFQGNDPEAEFAKAFNAQFEQEDAAFLIVMEALGPTDVLDRRLLTWQLQLASELNAMPELGRIDAISLIAAPRYGMSALFTGRTVEPAPVLREFPVTAVDEARMREFLALTPLAHAALVSDDLTAAQLTAFLLPEAGDFDTMAEMTARLEKLLAENPPPDGYRVSLSGLPAVRVDIVRNLKRDQALLTPLVAVVFTLLLFAIFRRVAFAVLPMAAVGVGLAWTMGLYGYTGQSFNIISNVLPVLLLVIGVSNCVHIVSRYGMEAVLAHGDREQAAEQTIRHTAAACLLAAGTTAIGFLSLVGGASAVLSAFGVQAAIGLLLLYLSAMLVLAPALAWVRPPGERQAERQAKRGQTDSLGDAAIEAIGYAASRHPYVALLLCGLLVAGSCWSARNLQVDTFVVETYDEDQPTLKLMRLVEEKLVGLSPMQISLTTDDPEAFFRNDTWRRLLQFEDRARAMPGVTLVRSYVDLGEAVYAGSRSEGPFPPATAAGEEALTKRIAWSRSLLPDLAETLHLSAFLTADQRSARVLLRLRDIGAQQTLLLAEKLQADLQKTFPPDGPIRYRITGEAYVKSLLLYRLIRNLLASLAAASVIIFFVIGLLFRSARVGLIAVLPNLTPLVATLGYMGLRDYPLNVSNVIVFSISLGIAVDDTIHFLARFREEIQAGHSRSEAIRLALHGSGRAIVLTSILIIAGISVLLLSEFLPTRRFAELVSITMLAALFGDLLLLPACLSLFWKDPPTDPAADNAPTDEHAKSPDQTD